jgi:SAM-dependent methyltransferase
VQRQRFDARLKRVKDLRFYDAISSGYVSTRRADPRIARYVHTALGDAQTIVNIGAGTGNYEPGDHPLVAVEPSAEMIAKRPEGSAPAVRAAAENLPFPDRCFDAAMAVLTIHHWQNWRRGLAEMGRVARKQVIYLYEPVMISRFWPMDGGYWPEAVRLPSERDAIGVEEVASVLDIGRVDATPIPIDCIDGFGAAFWGRPEAYLDPEVQQGMSWLAQLPPDVLARGSARLAADLQSGEWDRRHGHLRHLEQLDVGYRLITAHT